MYKQLIVSGTVTAQRRYVENLEVTATSSVTTDGRIDFALMDEVDIPEPLITSFWNSEQLIPQHFDHVIH